MPIDWQNKDTNDRILAAIIGSVGGNINCREVARLFGPEATYNAIENFLRKPKKKALELRKEAEKAGRDAPAPSPARPRTGAASSARKSKSAGVGGKNGVRTGRVTKAKKNGSYMPSTPVKKERVFIDSDDDDMFDEEMPGHTEGEGTPVHEFTSDSDWV